MFDLMKRKQFMTELSKDSIDLSVAEAYLQGPEQMDLSLYSRIDAKGATHLANHLELPFLLLGGLHSISPDAAKELAEYKGRVSMHALQDADDEVAEILSTYMHPVIVQDSKVAEKIGRFLGPMQKESAQPIVEMVLDTREFSDGELRFTNVLHTGCYFSLTKEAAESLVSVVPPLYLQHVRSLDVEVAEVLALKQHLTLSNLTTLPLDSLKALTEGSRKSLYLDSLEFLDSGMAEVFVAAEYGFLALNGLSELSEEVAEVFSGLQSDTCLYLDGLKEISAGVARRLSKMGKLKALSLSLKGLKEISDEVAEILAEFEGAIMTFDKKTRMSEKTRELFAKRMRMQVF